MGFLSKLFSKKEKEQTLSSESISEQFRKIDNIDSFLNVTSIDEGKEEIFSVIKETKNKSLIEIIEHLDKELIRFNKLRTEFRTLSDSQKQEAERLGCNLSDLDQTRIDELYSELCNIVNKNYNELEIVSTYFKENKQELIDFYTQFFVDGEYIEPEIPEELLLEEETQKKLDEILADEQKAQYFFDVVYPRSLEKNYGITREEYDKMIEEADKAEEKISILSYLVNEVTTDLEEENSLTTSGPDTSKTETSEVSIKTMTQQLEEKNKSIDNLEFK